MDDPLLTHAVVQMRWASRHCWTPGGHLGFYAVPAMALWLGIHGTVDVEVSDRHYRLEPGSVLLLPGNRERRIETPRGAEWLSVGISAYRFEHLDLLPFLEAPRSWTPPVDILARLRSLMETVESEWESQNSAENRHQLMRMAGTTSLPVGFFVSARHRDPFSNVISDGIAAALFGLLWRGLVANPEEKQTISLHPAVIHGRLPVWLTETLEQIVRRPEEAHPDALARAAKLSATRFRRGFRHYLGLSPQAYITAQRLEVARHLLETTDLSVAAVAERVGLTSVPYFTRHFKARFQVPPAQYRRRLGPAPSV